MRGRGGLKLTVSSEEAPSKDKHYRKYASGVERALTLFETALQEWADYISFLNRLLKVTSMLRAFKILQRLTRIQGIASSTSLGHHHPCEINRCEATLPMPQPLPAIGRPPKGPRGLQLHLRDDRSRWIVQRSAALPSRPGVDALLRLPVRQDSLP